MFHLEILNLSGLKPIPGFEDGKRYLEVKCGEHAHVSQSFVTSAKESMELNDKFQFQYPLARYLDFRLRNGKCLSDGLKKAEMSKSVHQVCARINLMKMETSWRQMLQKTENDLDHRPAAWSIKVPLTNKHAEEGAETATLTLQMHFDDLPAEQQEAGSMDVKRTVSAMPSTDHHHHHHSGDAHHHVNFGAEPSVATARRGSAAVSAAFPRRKSIIKPPTGFNPECRRSSHVGFRRKSIAPHETSAIAGAGRDASSERKLMRLTSQDVTDDVDCIVKEYTVNKKMTKL